MEDLTADDLCPHLELASLSGEPFGHAKLWIEKGHGSLSS